MTMADVHGSPGDAPQMPAAGSGPAPVPYAGADQSPEPPVYAAAAVTWNMPGPGVMDGVTGNAVQESGYAHDTGAGLVNPYYAGAVSPIQAHGDADAGGHDDVSATVAGAVANATARYLEHEGDTHPQGSTIGDLMDLPPVESSVRPDSQWGPFAMPLQPPSGSFT
jgi:hypothetical protein